MDELELLYEDEFLRVQAKLNDRADRTVLCFTGIGKAISGDTVQMVEFYRASTADANAVFIIDKTRSWGNRIDFDRLITALTPLTAGRRLYTIGNSMGGFLAILMSSFLDVRCTVAFVPQFSVDAEVMPEETRWEVYRSQIARYRYPSLDGHFNASAKYYLFHSGKEKDRNHWEKMPSAPNVKQFVFRDFGHGAAKRLKVMGLLDTVIGQCFEEKDPTAILKANFDSDSLLLL
jgi:hypothetical protein